MLRWLLARPLAMYAGGFLLAVAAVALWFRAHDARVKREAVVAERIKATEQAIAEQTLVISATQDSLRVAREKTDTVRIQTQAAGTNYARQRAGVNIAAPQPAGTPANMVVVPIAFVRAADSLAVLVPVLLATITLERAASERRIEASDSARALLVIEVEQLKVAVKAARPGLSGKLKYMAIGAGIAFAGIQLLGNRQ